MIFGYNSAFPDNKNAFYNKEFEQEHFLGLISDQDISGEIALYCIEKYGDKIEYLKTHPGNKFVNDIDFLLRFLKCNNLKSEPNVSLV